MKFKLKEKKRAEKHLGQKQSIKTAVNFPTNPTDFFN